MKSVGCVLLMGGKSSRMGEDKAFLKYKEQYFWERIAKEMEGIARTYLSLASKEKAPRTHYEIIEDEYKEIGPIGGIHAGLKYAKEDFLFFAPCDIPTLNHMLIRKVIKEVSSEYEGVVLASKAGKVYPTVGIYSKKLLDVLEFQIKQKDYRLMNLVRNYRVKVVPIDTLGINHDLININTKLDYSLL